MEELLASHDETTAWPSEATGWLLKAEPSGTVLRTSYQGWPITLARFRHCETERALVEAYASTGVVTIMQISQRPEYRYDFGDGVRVQPTGARDTFNIAHLDAAPWCEMGGQTDALQLHVPLAAIEELARESDQAPVGTLSAPNGWNSIDPMLVGFRNMALGMLERPHNSQLFIDHVLLALHTHVTLTYGGLHPRSRPSAGRLAPWQERRAKEMMAGGVDIALSVEDLAQACGLSVGHFSRAFKVSTGVSPHRWIQSLRVERAKALIRTGSLSIAEVALASGFADQSHLTRVFSRLVGQTPGAWRRALS
jgi:AraC family transcriptional regulator